MLASFVVGVVTDNVLLFLPPAIFGLIMIVAPNRRYFLRLPGFTVIAAIAFVRYVLIPFAMMLEPEQGASIYTARSVYLYVVEEMAILISLSIFYGRAAFKEEKPVVLKAGGDYMLLFVVVASAVLVLMNPSILARYHTIFQSAIQVGSDADAAPGFILLVVSWGKLLLPIVIANYLVAKRFGRNSSISYSISIVVFALSMMFFSGTSRQSALIPGVAGLFFLLKFYKNRRSQTIILMMIALVGSFVGMTALKSTTYFMSGNVSSVAHELSAYFSGVDNMEYSYRAFDQFSEVVTVQTLISDLFGNCPGVSLDLSNRTTVFYNYSVYGSDLASDQIIPLAGQGLFYLGPAFFWIPSVLAVYFAKRLDGCVMATRTPCATYLWSYAAIVFGMSFMLNASIVGAYVFQVLIPCLAMLLVGEALKPRAYFGFGSTRKRNASAGSSFDKKRIIDE